MPALGPFTLHHGSFKVLCVPILKMKIIVVVRRLRVVGWDNIAIDGWTHAILSFDGLKSYRQSDHRQLFEKRLANIRFSINMPM